MLSDLRASVEDIVVTPQLYVRAARTADLNAEVRAFNLLSQALLVDAANAARIFVDLALELCPQAGSAGLSELEDHEDGVQFRWTALSGLFAPYVGGTTPRDDSPCGLCLDAHHAILVDRPTRRFGYLDVPNAPIVEGLVVPLYDTAKTPLGTIWIVSHTPGSGFDATDVRTIEQLAILLALGLKLRAEQRLARPQLTDTAELICRIAASSDRAAFRDLFDQYAGRVKTFLVRRGYSETQAEDGAQDTMLTIWRQAAEFDRDRASAEAWIYAMARNHKVGTELHSFASGSGAMADSHAEIATRLNVPKDIVVSRIRLAAEALRDRLRGGHPT